MSVYTKCTGFFTSKLIQNNAIAPFLPFNQVASLLQIRCHRKHWNIKFQKLRREKVIKVDLPKYDLDTGVLPREKRRSLMKECGVLPPRPWSEKPIFISSTSSIFEAYLPPEGDGKYSIVSKTGAKQKFTFVEKKSRSMMAVRKIKQFEEDFRLADFVEDARDIYLKAHEALANKNNVELIQYVTEKAYPEMLHNLEDKTIHWKFIKSLEPARVVQARCVEVITKQNVFAQITVRFHTQQILAIYDRFGRLMHGSEIITKDVLDYVVFEKHIANEYGVWRLHGKIIPSWMAPREPSSKTYVQRKEQPEEDDEASVVPTESVHKLETQSTP